MGVPRLTTAHWRYESGAVGSLTHGVMLHGDTYECEMEVWGDGIRIRLEDPYGKARLLVSRDKGAKNRQVEECFTFPRARTTSTRRRSPPGSTPSTLAMPLGSSHPTRTPSRASS